MSTGNDNDRYVVEHDEGWAVVKELHERASAVFATQEEAMNDTALGIKRRGRVVILENQDPPRNRMSFETLASPTYCLPRESAATFHRVNAGSAAAPPRETR